MRASSLRAGSPSSTTTPPGRLASAVAPLVRRTVTSGRGGVAAYVVEVEDRDVLIGLDDHEPSRARREEERRA